MPISLNEGRVFALHRPENVLAGQWYLVVLCRGCREAIYLLTDPSKGAGEPQMTGKGKLRVPCPSCFHDDQYEPSEVQSHQATVDVQFRLETPNPSGSPRQPLKFKHGKVRPIFGAEFLEDRPEATAALGRCIALWPEVESEEARLLARLLDTGSEASAAMFLTLRNARAQRDVLDAVAAVKLNERDQALLEATLRVCRSAEALRNDLAHGRWGGAYAITRGIIWIDPRDLVRHQVRVESEGVTEEATEWVRTRSFVYEPEDLATIAVRIVAAKAALGRFIGYLEPGWDARGERDLRYKQLCDDPEVAEQLRIMAERKSK